MNLKKLLQAWLGLVMGVLPLSHVGSQESAHPQGNRVQIENAVLIALRDVHPLHGGQNLYLRRDGTGICQVVFPSAPGPELREKRYKLALSPNAVSRLLRQFSDRSFQNIPSSTKLALPDTPRISITVWLASGQGISASRWASDKDGDFEGIYQSLMAIVREAQARGQPAGELEYDALLGAREFQPR
jgi:hypothetical protein